MLLYSIFAFLLVASAAFIFLTNNPVYSVFSLILAFIFSACILLLINIDFIALLFIMVYVGAVAVLFLFVIMMIDTKSIKKKIVAKNIIKHPFLKFMFIFSIICIFIIEAINNTFFNENSSNISESLKAISIDLYHYMCNFDSLSNNSLDGSIQVLSQAMFNTYGHCIVYAGLILLVALIGAICLTINYKEEKKKKDRISHRNTHNSIKYYS